VLRGTPEGPDRPERHQGQGPFTQKRDKGGEKGGDEDSVRKGAAISSLISRCQSERVRHSPSATSSTSSSPFPSARRVTLNATLRARTLKQPTPGGCEWQKNDDAIAIIIPFPVFPTVNNCHPASKCIIRILCDSRQIPAQGLAGDRRQLPAKHCTTTIVGEQSTLTIVNNVVENNRRLLRREEQLPF